MKQNFFSCWKELRYVICALIATWGFWLLFVEGSNSGGRILLMIAAIGVLSTMMLDIFDKHMNKKK